MEPHLPRKLDAKMPKTTNALHGDQISAAQAGITKSIVGRDASAEERGGFCGPKLIGNGGEAARFSNHYFRVSSIYGDSRDHRILTIHHVSASARFARPVFASDEADTHPLTDLPPGYACTQRLNAANNFMPRNARQG
jgi:hypothetical protein